MLPDGPRSGPYDTLAFFHVLRNYAVRGTLAAHCRLATGRCPLPTAHCILLFFRRIVFNNYKNYNYKEKRYELAESP